MSGKTVVVTGATGTLGRAVIQRFIEDKVIFGNVDYWSIQACAKSDKIVYNNVYPCFYQSVDVTDESQVEQYFADIGPLDALITCAGISLVKPALDLTLQDWQSVIDVNLTGTFLCAREAIKHGCKRIVTIGSIHGCTPTSYPMRAAYTASKAAVTGLTIALAVEFAPMGVSVNCVAPGHLPALMDGTGAGQALLDAAKGRTPTGSLATPEDIAEIVFWLCDGAPMAMTGQVIVCDGGFTLDTFPLGD